MRWVPRDGRVLQRHEAATEAHVRVDLYDFSGLESLLDGTTLKSTVTGLCKISSTIHTFLKEFEDPLDWR